MILALAAAAASSISGCAPSATDQAWIGRARAAWHQQVRAIPGLSPPPKVSVILFDRRCRLSSRTALALGRAPDWRSTPHGGRVLLNDGTRIPVGVTSFAGEGKGGVTFVMALPSVWRGKVNGGPVGLEALTTAVMLHEASHVAQGALLGEVSKLVARQRLPDSFNDDSIQDRFEKEPAFAAEVAEETRLLFAAAEASDREQARRLAAEASRRMAERRVRWFTGDEAYLARAEDLFLTLEGSGQYVGWHWLIDPRGGGFKRDVAMRGWGQRGRKWSQKQGLALILAVERLGLPGWQRTAWGKPELPGKELLDAALAG